MREKDPDEYGVDRKGSVTESSDRRSTHDKTRDSLHTTSSSETSDSGLGDTLDVLGEGNEGKIVNNEAQSMMNEKESFTHVSQDLPVPLSPTFTQTFTTFSSTRHCVVVVYKLVERGWSVRCRVCGLFVRRERKSVKGKEGKREGLGVDLYTGRGWRIPC